MTRTTSQTITSVTSSVLTSRQSIMAGNCYFDSMSAYRVFGMLKAFVCRTFNHKWERIRGVEEAAHKCRRCGEVYYGPLGGAASVAGSPSGGDFGGGGLGGDGGGGDGG